MTQGFAPGPRVLVVDSTGRGHAICELFTRTNEEVIVYYGPGCSALEAERVVSVDSISLTDPESALRFLAAHPVEFVFVSNIDALSLGYVDVLRAAGHRVIGPTRAAAELESSKERGKQFCLAHGIPTAAHRGFTDPAQARDYIASLGSACVVKTDGLTPDGDGSVVCDGPEQALAAVEAIAVDSAGEFRVVVEERLVGDEISIFALLDGENYLLFPTAKDFKRTLPDDLGKNCDGMGSIAVHPADGPGLRAEIRRRLLDPFVAGLRAEGLDFTGFVYLGGMITQTGLVVVEINARFGDSEAEVVLPGVRSDFTDLCRAVLAKELDQRTLVTDGLSRCSVALTQGCLDPDDPRALPGWPFGAFERGQPVRGLDDVDRSKATVFYANLRSGVDGRPVGCGGRVAHVVGAGSSLAQARENAYSQVGRVSFPGMRFRADIGAAAERELAELSAGRPSSPDSGEETGESGESEVRSYVRSFPAQFATAKGDLLFAQDGAEYLDFLSGAGSVNYGHNPDSLKRVLIDYLERDGLTHGLDLSTTAKSDFLEAFQRHVLAARGLDYRVQFTSPSGTNAVEAALKLARVVTDRANVVSFSGGFHGVSMGSLAATGAAFYRRGVEHSMAPVTHVPYPDSPLGAFDSLDFLDRLVGDPSSGTQLPAAVILETVQGEGGVYVAPVKFLRGLRDWCDLHRVLLIVDEIQSGCGRTGTFFSFERAGIAPDLVTLAKSIGGYGLPMAILLIKPEYDVWLPGQHNGTFRGNQLAFTAGAAALREFWRDDVFATEVRRKGDLVGEYLRRRVTEPFGIPVRGMGLIWGVDLAGTPMTASKVSRLCFERGLVVETSGRRGDVLKILPPLTISDTNLVRGLDIIVEALQEMAGVGFGGQGREQRG